MNLEAINIAQSEDFLKANEVGREMYDLISELYPICRSITGNGVRQTLEILKRYIPLEVNEIPSGTQVFDWTVPKEWNIKEAHVKNSKGEKIIDFHKSNLHVLNYSVPVHKTMSLDELKEHLFTLPEHPEWIHYRTTYYSENWGFCLSHNQFLQLENGNYEVFIDSTLENGHLTYGELYLQGQQTGEILISCHACHPSLANDNQSGVALTTFLAKYLNSQNLRYSYRFLFIPGTIGAITWLCLNEAQAEKIRHGLVVACVGDSGRLTYKKSRRGNAEIDRAVIHVLKNSGDDYEILDFTPYGYDERQYCSPGFNLPVGSLTRTPHGRYPEYHTSADNLDLVKEECLADSFSKYMQVIYIPENNAKYISLNPLCEPQLGRRGLCGAIGGRKEAEEVQRAMLWVLNMSDGNNTLHDIAEKSYLPFKSIKEASEILLEHDLLKEFD